MKKYSILITDTKDYGRVYVIEKDNERAFYADVYGWHVCGRSDLGEESERREQLLEAEAEILVNRLQRGQHTKLAHGVSRYEYRYITFNGALVDD